MAGVTLAIFAFGFFALFMWWLLSPTALCMEEESAKAERYRLAALDIKEWSDRRAEPLSTIEGYANPSYGSEPKEPRG